MEEEITFCSIINVLFSMLAIISWVIYFTSRGPVATVATFGKITFMNTVKDYLGMSSAGASIEIVGDNNRGKRRRRIFPSIIIYLPFTILWIWFALGIQQALKTCELLESQDWRWNPDACSREECLWTAGLLYLPIVLAFLAIAERKIRKIYPGTLPTSLMNVFAGILIPIPFVIAFIIIVIGP